MYVVRLQKLLHPTLADPAEAGLKALTTAVDEGKSFELVLSDVHMPQVDGFTFVERIREDACLKSFPSSF